jgi:tRNA-splicing ligase RtcB
VKSRELQNLGIPKGKPIKLAIEIVKEVIQGGASRESVRDTIKAVAQNPKSYVDDATWASLANSLLESEIARSKFIPRTEPAPYQRWGSDMDNESVRQMDNACNLPVSVAGALMPDAHVGYGLPIGGVLATRNSVIPYAVGMDIACRMKLTVLDLPVSEARKDGSGM